MEVSSQEVIEMLTQRIAQLELEKAIQAVQIRSLSEVLSTPVGVNTGEKGGDAE